MRKKASNLTHKQIERAKSKEKPYRLGDGQGLYLLVRVNGSKYWESRYKNPTTEKYTYLGLGSFPVLTLQEARQKAQEVRKLVSEGKDPKLEREKKKIEQQRNNANTLIAVATKWFAIKHKTISIDYAKDIWRSLELHVFPYIAKLPIGEISAPKAIDILRPLEKKGKLLTLKRVNQILNEIMQYAVNTGVIFSNPLAGIRAAFEKPTKISNPCLPPEELPELMRAIATSKTKDVTKYLITWQLHTMTRSKEAAQTEWSEIDLVNSLWVIPGHKMKNKQEHKIPLTHQTLTLLETIKPISGHRQYVFPNNRDPNKNAHKQTVNQALRGMGLKGRTTSHGLRALARTTLNKQGFDRDVMEAALSHVEGSEVVKAYNRDDYLERRIPMMQWWSDHIEQASNCNISLTGHKTLRLSRLSTVKK